ncbi:hypothetical protein K7711_47190, partial [Nocardia sp. CA2R105]|uniref:hypothetical protein n=1 Tax=Nocardia coffeae TaxID=2873381 RepID=UPI001CA74688
MLVGQNRMFSLSPPRAIGGNVVRSVLRHDWRMEFQLAVSAPPDSHRFSIVIEPEAMQYEFPEEGKVVL